MNYIDTHCHLDGEEFNADREAVMQRAREAGVGKIFLPAIDLPSSQRILSLCLQHPGFLYPMVGLHPEEVRADWREQLAAIKELIISLTTHLSPLTNRILAIGEVGLDFYWSREFEQEQLEAFEEQVCWAVEFQLPLMIHCRKAQNELVAILKRYKDDLPGGVFHCFTGNDVEARQLLEFSRPYRPRDRCSLHGTRPPAWPAQRECISGACHPQVSRGLSCQRRRNLPSDQRQCRPRIRIEG